MIQNLSGPIFIHMAKEFSESQHGHIEAPTVIGNALIMTISGIVVVFMLVLCIKFLLFPKEKEDTHIKKRILDDEIQNNREIHREREP
jgi:uncharacterized membrane protein